jgi:hypothetical protein
MKGALSALLYSQSAAKFLRAALSACACWYLGVFCVIAAMRLLFPGAVEWYESGMYYMMLRVLGGQALYGSPSIEYVPTIYPPLYIYLSAALARITGPEFFTLRIVSTLSTLGTMALICALVCRETRSRSAGLWAAGIFAATYHASATYFDIGRIDPLFLVLFLGSLYALRFAPGMHGCLCAGALLAASALTKQTALVLFMPLCLWVWISRPRVQALCFTGTTAALVGLASLLLNAACDGWYFYYVFELPSQHAVLWDRIGSFWLQQILPGLGLAAGMTAAYFFLVPFKTNRGPVLLYALTFITMLAASCMHWMKLGGFKNVIMPAHAALAIGAGLALGAVGKSRLRLSVYGAALVQFCLLWYNPLARVPEPGSADVVRRSVAAVRAVEGEVFAPAYGYLAVMAGKKHSAHIGFINDILWGRPGPVRDRLIREIKNAIREQRFAAILLDRPFGAFQRDIEAHYVLCPQYAAAPEYWPLIKYWYIPAAGQP